MALGRFHAIVVKSSKFGFLIIICLIYIRQARPVVFKILLTLFVILLVIELLLKFCLVEVRAGSLSSNDLEKLDFLLFCGVVDVKTAHFDCILILELFPVGFQCLPQSTIENDIIWLKNPYFLTWTQVRQLRIYFLL